MNGYILIDKQSGWTSFDVVAKIRGILRNELNQKIKVGHAGTLDPFATGLLVVLIGSATKQQDMVMKQDKVYDAALRLGATSTTGDPEGEITENVTAVSVAQKEVDIVLKTFTGTIFQTPPAHSAIKVKGQRAYELARKGKEVKLEPRQVTVHDLVKVDYSYPTLALHCSVSSGTYIRSLAADIGESLGVGAYLTSLRRISIGDLHVRDAVVCNDTLDFSVVQSHLKSL